MDAEQLVVEHMAGKIRGRKGPEPKYTPEVAKARQNAQTTRYREAGRIARAILQCQHPDEYRLLYEAALVRVKNECGPLPGDEEVD